MSYSFHFEPAAADIPSLRRGAEIARQWVAETREKLLPPEPRFVNSSRVDKSKTNTREKLLPPVPRFVNSDLSTLRELTNLRPIHGRNYCHRSRDLSTLRELTNLRPKSKTNLLVPTQEREKPCVR